MNSTPVSTFPSSCGNFRSNDNFGLVARSACSPINILALSISPVRFREAGIQVAIGGFHVSGCLSMLDGNAVDLDACRDMGVSIFAGEAGRSLRYVAARCRGRIVCSPSTISSRICRVLRQTPTPFCPLENVERTLGLSTSFDAGRGCPYQCSFCTIINVQGRKSRFRSPDDVESIVRTNWAQGISRFFITDDNFARNKNWEEILDRLIWLRETQGIPLGLLIQVDTLCHKIPNFIEKCKRAGVTRVFIGLENINPDNLLAAKKRQNKITEYRKMLSGLERPGHHDVGGLHPWFPRRHAGSIRNDIEIIKRELPLDIVEFFCLTPLPGSEDHQLLWKSGITMDPDSTITTSNMSARRILGCRSANGQASITKPGRSTIRRIIWRCCCGAPRLPALK